MQNKLVKIGNSMCVRIPKQFLKEAGIDSEIEMKLLSDGILISPSVKRQGWEKKFTNEVKNDDITFVDGNLNSNDHEWEW